jgi:aspartate--ammonia ligase
MGLIIPRNYKSILDLKQTEIAIKLVKDTFQQNLSSELRLIRITAPLFVLKGTGVNDDLTGVERKVTFPIKDMGNREAEVVNSLAKWKRIALSSLDIEEGFGIYTDMNAVRPDEEMGNLHSLYVDQWDWELVMNESQRNLDFLVFVVRKIYEVIKRTEFVVYEHYPEIKPLLPQEIKIIHSEELLQKFPHLTPKEREIEYTRQHKAVFIIGIGCKLSNGQMHDGRAPDYDDWSTASNGLIGLNGDILIWHPVLGTAMEISSMGIRVNKETLKLQLELMGMEERLNLEFHKKLINGELPQTIGGGIGQSRLCMFYLRKAHIGEVQANIWPEEMVEECRNNNIILF